MMTHLSSINNPFETIKNDFLSNNTFDIISYDNLNDAQNLICPYIKNDNNDDIINIMPEPKFEKEDTIKKTENIEKPSNFIEPKTDKKNIKSSYDYEIKSDETINNTNKKKKRKYERKLGEKKINNDNRFRQTKVILRNTSMNYTNFLIKKVYNNNIGNGVFKKQLHKVSYSKIKNVDINSLREFMSITLGEFFSLNITEKYKCYVINPNKKLIEQLLNEKNDEIRELFNNLFNKTFREWAQCLVDAKDELKIIYEEELKNRDKELFKESIKKFDSEIQSLRPRKTKKK